MIQKINYKVLAILLIVSLVFSNMAVTSPVYADDEGFTSYSNDEMVYDFNFGTDVTADTLYNENVGYGFSDEFYPNAADGWVNGIYHPRQKQVVTGSAVYVKADVTTGPAISLPINSKVWTETESTGYGVYTYENTSTFDVDLDNADYDITVTLSNPTDAAYTAYLETEDITKLSDITVGVGETVEKTFTSSLINGQLNLKFLAKSYATAESAATVSTVYVSHVTIVRQATNQTADKPTLFIASDSTVQTYDSYYYPQTGWGQVLYNFFGDFISEKECEDCTYAQAQTYETDKVIIENRAIGGRSSRSFIEEGKLDDLLEDVKPGDYVLVQWAHNDATYSRPNRYVSSTDFAEYLQYYIDGCKQRGATCILVTPVARYSYNANGTFNSDFEAYRQVMKNIGEVQGVPVLDLTGASMALCEEFGIEGSKSLFLQLAAGEYEGYYSGGVSDATHLQYYGAYKFAQCVAKLILSYETDDQLDTLKPFVNLNLPTEVPADVTNLTAVSIGASSVSLTWNAAEGSELYYIYRSELQAGQTPEDVDFSNAVKYSVNASAKYTDSGCKAGVTYVYAIRAFNEYGLGNLSDKLTVTTKSSKYKFDFCQVATNPTMSGWQQVTCTQLYTKEVGYGWITAPGNGRYRKGNGNADSSDMADDFCLGAGEFAVDLPNGDYEIKIYAGDLLAGTSTIKASYTAEGSSIGTISTKQKITSLSAKVRVTDGQLNVTVGGTNPYINGMEITPVLLSPSNLSYSELEFGNFNVTFLINFDKVGEAVSYNVYRKASSDEKFNLIKTIAAADKDTLDARSMVADMGETYEYYVTSVIADGSESAKSNSISVTTIDKNVDPPVAPTNLSCISAAEAHIVLGWDTVQNAIYYNVYRSSKAEGSKGFNDFTKAGYTTEKTFTDTYSDIDTNIHYYYKVEAVGRGGLGPLSKALETPITESMVRDKAENLVDRALVAVDLSGNKGAEINVTSTDSKGVELTSGIYLSWRLLKEDPNNVTFDLYRNGERIASKLRETNFIDRKGKDGDIYEIKASSDSFLGIETIKTEVWDNYYVELQLDKPTDQTMPDESTCTYTANDMSVGDLNGDGDYELLVKWTPSNAQDNSKAGYTGTTIIDAYDIDSASGRATILWRIDLGVNIRSGAHYTQFQVWDFDGDKKAELICKTADGSTTYKKAGGSFVETGHVGACNASALPTNTVSSTYDYRNSSGYILNGPEYLTIFDGETGAILDTTDYIPERGNVSDWGDAYGNRVDRFLSCVAYLDGETPSAVFCRGYYSRMCLTAYDFVDTDGDGKGNELNVRWKFDTNNYPKEKFGETEAQGNHGISVVDIDADGKDEIIYGAVAVDHDGTLKYTTGLGHGDAMHVSDWIPSHEGLEVFSVHEHTNAKYQVEIHDAETGVVLWGYYTGVDTGRGLAADVDPNYEGAEVWANAAWNGTDGGLYSSTSTLDNFIKIADTTPSVNFSLFWDGDLLSELQDHNFNSTDYVPISTNITNWNYETKTSETLFESSEIYTSNGTKGNMGLVADILGDWREEIIARTSADASKIRIYTSTLQTGYSIPCLMENNTYRIGVAWQNVGYNQPAHSDYLLSEGIKTAEVTAGEVTKKDITLLFTRAADGIFGDEIEGYEIYRKTGVGDYELIRYIKNEKLDIDSTGKCYYKDKSVDPDTTYLYKIAARVQDKTSYMSKELEVLTPAE